MKIFLFPGQGSQIRGMGGELFPKYPELVAAANEILGYDVVSLCLRDPDRCLNKTQFTQPALYVVSALSYLDRTATESKPDYLLGHSFGEYVALFAAGAFSFETGLKLVRKRAELMSNNSGGGSMAALLGMNIDQVSALLKEHRYDSIDIANHNSYEQIVITGPTEDIISAQQVFEDNDIKLYFPLNVSGAFHSRYMKDAAAEFGRFAAGFKFNPLQIPVIANVTARPYKNREIPELLQQQVMGQVRWYESVSYLLKKGVTEFYEIGPGDVLKKMQAYIEKHPMFIAEDAKEIQPAASNTSVKDIAVTPESLGSSAFKKDYGVRYAYVTGAMVHGIASRELVVKMGKARLLGYFGTGGLRLHDIEAAILDIKEKLDQGEPFGMNLLNGPRQVETVALFMKHDIRNIEASAYMNVTPELVLLRIKGIQKNADGSIVTRTRIMAKLSRPEVATAFLSPAQSAVLNQLLMAGKLTAEEVALAAFVPMADDICVESDSGGHTDGGVAFTLLPSIMRLRDELKQRYGYKKDVRIGAAGGIGTPEAAAAAFIMGADFILTGSINQCTAESGMSSIAKDMLQEIEVQDTQYAPAGDMFEIGARVQVVRKGTFFPGRANKLYELYRNHNSLEEIDADTRAQIQQRYFKRSFDEVYEDVKAYYSSDEIAVAEKNPKQKMAYIFRWYFGYSNALALKGNETGKPDFQIHCGPALGAFNRWVKNTPLENWQNRHVDEIAEIMMTETAKLLTDRFRYWQTKIQ
ncbi:ACP S-malonyltransferase [Taibaiella soli]|uniref:[acyl-carrier-protein] S-malonyltransferase n=1 Tax=Taibaiella soli TaxID=1649169 RepID=A0A2W2B798_9BACT|nr:ACP S-malonyltransferase [Taibaiella soli]PZF71887.1 [acyl-carrier-protein] S-malonyltransferase [Taibaiella soli]